MSVAKKGRAEAVLTGVVAFAAAGLLLVALGTTVDAPALPVALEVAEAAFVVPTAFEVPAAFDDVFLGAAPEAPEAPALPVAEIPFAVDALEDVAFAVTVLDALCDC
jgi:hypothetical protein